MATWKGPAEPEFLPLTLTEKVRLAARGLFMAIMMIILMVLFWICRLLEWPFGSRTASNAVIWVACAWSCKVMGLKVEAEGEPMSQGGARVCNHSSYIDIFVIRAASQIFYVAKAEVRNWPVLGFIADQTGTMFIERKRTEAKRQEGMFAERLHKGDRLCFFPEGTSSDGLRVLPFKSTLFSAFLSDELKDEMWVQPVTVFYEAGEGLRRDFYGWWGDIDFGPHLVQILARSRGSRAKVVFHEPVRARDFANRKLLAAHCEEAVRSAHDREIKRLGIDPSY